VTNNAQVDLADLFAVAQKTIASHRQEINDLDGYNGNHGDNMVENVQLIADALQQRRDQPPAAALEYASQRIQKEGRGGTSPYYAQGLARAAQQVQGRSGLTTQDALTVVQSLLAAVPTEGHPEQAQAGGSVLDLVLGMMAGPSSASQPQAQPSAQRPHSSPLGGLLKSLLPAALNLLQGQQSQEESPGMGEALLGALTGSQQLNPLQTGKPRPAAGGLLAQSLLSALSSRSDSYSETD